ncbi:MAG TPA: ATP-binding protein [Bryobacteraceae bacterium]|nr:ATP-binding protein [Bryobacteraceae bacterium]
MASRRWLDFVRPEDAVWLLLFSALGYASPSHYPEEIILLCCLALLQVLEPKVPALSTHPGTVAAVALKLLLGYALMAVTGQVNSSYYPILLLPVVSAATTLGILGTAVFTALACGSYVSFLGFVDWGLYTLPPEEVRELSLRLLFLVVVGYLVHRLAEAGRAEKRRYQAAAEQLVDANRSLREAEAAVRRSERLAALGQLSAGLAHELRNPLGTIRASAEMLRKRIAVEDGVAAELAGFISTEVDRTNSLITRFLEFARPLELRLAVESLDAMLDKAVARLERDDAVNKVTVFKNYSPDVRPFAFDAELMERVIYNLLRNAAQASPPDGAVTIKTRPADGYAEISVIDRGSGVDPKHRENIFNPFFTTKPDGVGLGLAIVSKIVDQHGGKMAVASEPGKGSAFHVYLPLRSIDTDHEASHPDR